MESAKPSTSWSGLQFGVSAGLQEWEVEMASLAFKLFGTYHLFLDGAPIDAKESDKARALLAYLAIECHCSHSREKLIGLFWPEQDDTHARGSLSQALYHLRGTLGDRSLTGELATHDRSQISQPFLLVSSQHIQLNPRSDIITDVAEFTALTETGKTHPHPVNQICEDCLDSYQKAAQTYEADFLDGFYLPRSVAFEEWVTVIREQLRLKAIKLLECLVVSFERKGELDQALKYARQMVRLDELSDAGNQHVMRLLALLGRHGEAISHYNSFQRMLAIQLGAEPGLDCKSLYQFLNKEELGEEPGNLPASLTPFIGRKRELDELWGLLRDSRVRLISVLGLGGSGKTRLILEAARRQRYSFRDGVYFVPLSALATGSSLAAAIAEGMGIIFREGSVPEKQLKDYLGHKKVLLVLDSFETVVKSAGLVAEILSVSQGSKALVSTRVQLNVSGEHLYPLDGMSVPPEDAMQHSLEYSSAELFIEAARRVKPGFLPENIEDIGRICLMVEGMPLSILLASSWVGDYSPGEIADEIDRSLDFLQVEWSDLPERQHSLRATFEYSWDLLNTNEQLLMMDLATFRNPFTLQSAQRVAGASIYNLHGLAGKSLLIKIPQGRYLMHDLIRQYSTEKLAASGERESFVRQKHCSYFLRQAAQWSLAFKGPEQARVLDEADRVITDVQAAWEWAAKRADRTLLLLAVEGFLLYYFLRYRFQEGEQACQVKIEMLHNTEDSGEGQYLKGWLLAWRAEFCRLSGKAEQARQCADQGVLMLTQAAESGQDVRRGQALLWRELGYLAGSLNEQLNCFLHSAELFKELDDAWWQASILSWAGEFANRLGDRKQSYTLLQQAVDLSRKAGEPCRLAATLKMLAYYLLILGPWDQGKSLMEESARWERSVGNKGSLANADLADGVAQGWTGNFPAACYHIELANERFHQLGDHYYIAFSTLALALAEIHSGKYEHALTAVEIALEVARKGGFRREEAGSLTVWSCIRLLQGEAHQVLYTAQQSVLIFRQMGFAGELGMALGAFALAQHQLGQNEQAWKSLLESLRIFVEINSRFTIFTLAAAIVVLLADAGCWVQAVEAYTALMGDPIVANSRWFADVIGNRYELAREKLGEAAYQAAEGRGREGDVFEVLGSLEQEIGSLNNQPSR